MVELVKTLGTTPGVPPKIYVMVPPPLMAQYSIGANQTVINSVYPKLVPLIGHDNLPAVTGVVDLFDNTASNYYSESWYEVAPYYTKLNHIYAIGSWVFSEEWWQSLPEEHQTAIEEAAAEAQAQQPELQAEQDAQALAQTEEAGSTIISDIDRDVWIEKLKPVREEYAAKIPGAEELLEIIAEADPEAGPDA